MPIKVSKNQNRITVVEYEVRPLDAFGDSIEVFHYETAQEAVNLARELLPANVAVVVEKHTSRRPAHLAKEPDTYIVIAVGGLTMVLKAWGWKGEGAQL